MKLLTSGRKETLLQKNYHLMAFLGPPQSGIDDARFTQAVWLIYEWVKQNAADKIWLPELPRTFGGSDAKSGKSVAAIYEPEGHFFTLRYSVSGQDGARENTEVELRPYHQRIAFAVRATTYLPSGITRKPSPALPGFILPIIRKVELNDGVPILSRPWPISENTVDSLVEAISSVERKLPIVAISQARNPWIGVDGYAIDSWRCASALAGVAHVATIPWEVTFPLSERMGSEWSCYNGAVRIYWPGGIEFYLDDPYQHPLYTLKVINELIFDGTFIDYLKQLIWENHLARPIDWSAFGIEFYIEAEQAHMAAASDVESPDDVIRRCREQIDRLHESLEEYKALADEYYADMTATREDSQGMLRRMAALTSLVDRQRLEITRLKHGEKEAVPLDLGYKELPAWVERYYPDRLYLHPRAVRALKDATYQNASMVYRCLVLLAEDYRDYRMGSLGREEFLKRCSLVDPGLTECGYGEESNIGEQGNTYYITYNGRRCLLERHLKKGVSHNPLYCLRIYFFWDAKNALVVIGSLPGHLRSSDT